MKKAMARLYLWLSGWKVSGEAPTDDRYMIIAAPHTSNGDFCPMLAIAFALGLDLHWMGKHTLFRWPLGWFMRRLGGVPIDRRAAHNTVAAIVEEFRRRERFVLAVAPSATRAYREYWKSGFYWVARGAQVPIYPGFLDYARREGGCGPKVMPTEDIRATMDSLRAFYADKAGKYPEKVSRVRLRAEDENGAEAGREPGSQ